MDARLDSAPRFGTTLHISGRSNTGSRRCRVGPWQPHRATCGHPRVGPARAQRAHLNLLQNLAPFAILVLVAQVSGKANATTALGATIFFWARVAHAAVYIAGIRYLRTLVFAVATLGAVLILTQLF